MQMIAAPIPSQQAPPLTNTLPLNALLTGVRAKDRGASKLLTEPSRNSAKLHGIHHRPTRPSMKAECNRIAYQLASTVSGEAWYGDSLRQILRDVSAMKAQAHPATFHPVQNIVPTIVRCFPKSEQRSTVEN